MTTISWKGYTWNVKAASAGAVTSPPGKPAVGTAGMFGYKNATGTNFTTWSTFGPGALSAGHSGLCVVAVPASSTVTISDSVNGSWTQIATANTTGLFLYVFAYFKAKAITLSQLTFNQTVNQFASINFFDVPNVYAVDVTNSATGSSTAPSVASAAQACTGDLELAIFATTGAGNTTSTPSGWTSTINMGTGPFVDMYYRTSSALSGDTATSSYAASSNWVGLSIALMPTGMNHWGDSVSNAFVDVNAYLHLVLNNDGTYWRAVELENQTAMGYGRYQWVVDFSVVGDPMGDNLTSTAPSVLNWDVNTVLGLYTYDLTGSGNAGNFFRENDIQFSNFGDPNAQSPALLVTQPGVAAGGVENNQSVGVLTGNGPYTCTFIWQAGQAYFSVVDVNGAICCEHLVSGAAVQAPGTACVPVMNLWLNGGNAPVLGQQEVIIQNFTFASGTTHAIAQANTFVAPFISSTNQLLIHRPGPDSPDTLNPIVPITVTDAPDYTHNYPVLSLVPGINARARGTYSVVLSSYHWDSPDTPRLVEVVIIQKDYPAAGPLASGQYFPPITRTVTPNDDCQGNLVTIGNATLPVRDVPPDNTDALFYVSIGSANTLDRFQDVLLLDTMGQTTFIAVPTGTGFRNWYIDEPDITMDVGRVSGSASLRNRATSVLGYTRFSGGPLTADPGTGLIVVYGLPQAPGLSGTYSARYWADRTDSLWL